MLYITQKGLFTKGFSFCRKTYICYDICMYSSQICFACNWKVREYGQSNQSKRMGGVLKKAASFTPSHTRSLTSHEETWVFFCSPLSNPPQRKGVTRWMSLALAQTFSNNICLRLCVCACGPSVHSFQVGTSLPVSASTCPWSARLDPLVRFFFV